MNGEMDFMILNNKVKGVQGTVDNIDTKIDNVATKESIQEVKTLIENSGGGDALESTSQKILEKVKKSEMRGLKYLTATGTNSTIVSITGKGRFHFGRIYLITPKSVTGVVTIEIDGKTIFTFSSTNSAGYDTGYCYLEFSNPLHVIGIESLDPYYAFGATQLSFHYSANLEWENLNENSNLTGSCTAATNNAKAYSYLITDYLEFTESFEIKIANCSSSTKANICYSLDE